MWASLHGAPVEPHHTTAFVQPAGTLDTLSSLSYYSADHFWNRKGKRLPTHNALKQGSCALYLEYSLDGWNSLTFNGGYSIKSEDLHGKSQAFQDLEIGWKKLLCSTESSALTPYLIAIVPTGRKKPLIRYGQWGAEGAVLYSTILPSCGILSWCDLDLGYRWYSGAPSDQVRVDAAFGTVLMNKVWLIATGHLDYGIGNGHRKDSKRPIVLYPNFSLLYGKMECVFHVVWDLYMVAGGFLHLWGRNVGTGGGGYFGTWIDF